MFHFRSNLLIASHPRPTLEAARVKNLFRALLAGRVGSRALGTLGWSMRLLAVMLVDVALDLELQKIRARRE